MLRLSTETAGSFRDLIPGRGGDMIVCCYHQRFRSDIPKTRVNSCGRDPFVRVSTGSVLTLQFGLISRSSLNIDSQRPHVDRAGSTPQLASLCRNMSLRGSMMPMVWNHRPRKVLLLLTKSKRSHEHQHLAPDLVRGTLG